MLFQTPKTNLRKSRSNNHKGKQKDVDRAIHSIVGIEYKNCPATWKEVKKRITEDEQSFVNAIKNKLTER
jgi:hypothetical protein